MGRYWLTVLRVAFRQSLASVDKSPRKLLYLALVSLVAAALRWYGLGFQRMTVFAVRELASVAVASAVIVWVLFFVWHVLKTPYLMHVEASTSAANARGAAQDREHQRRAKLVQLLRQKYVTQQDVLSTDVALGLQAPDPEWVNKELRERGETFTVRAGKRRDELVIVNPKPQQ